MILVSKLKTCILLQYNDKKHYIFVAIEFQDILSKYKIGHLNFVSWPFFWY